MGTRFKCFWLEPINRITVELRRYVRLDEGCPGKYGYHNGKVHFKEIPAEEHLGDPTEEEKTLLQWPKKCDYCDYVFQPSDHWQFFTEHLYKRTDTSEIVTIRDAPVGAMWDAYWYKGHRPPGATEDTYDGKMVCLKTPGGDWFVDGPSYSSNKPGSGWTRSGTVPEITANPSILMSNYHGWLRSGWLEEC